MKHYNILLSENLKDFGNPQTTHWLEQMNIEAVSAESVSISFPNNFISSFVQQNIASGVEELLSKVLDRSNFLINYIVRGANDSLKEIVEQSSSQNILANRVVKKQKNRSGINARYTFDKYVVGTHNEMAHSVAKMISDNQDKTIENCNPFIIYSGTGLGKTHLVQSIYFSLAKQGIKSIYLTSERFVEMFIESTKSNTTNKFLENFREFETIIIDDIQFFENKPGTQEIFKKLFLHLVNKDKNIVLTLDRPIEKLNYLTEGLVDNISNGISMEITYPDFFTRLEIIKAKFSQNHKLNKIPDNLLTFIASRYDNVNVRVLEGVVNKVSFAYKHLGFSLESDKIQKFIAPDLKEEESYSTVSQLNIKKVVNEVCMYFGLKLSDLQGKSKIREISNPRQIAIYLLKELLDLSYETIGEFFNRTAVASQYAYTNIDKRLQKGDNVLQNYITDLRNLI